MVYRIRKQNGEHVLEKRIIMAQKKFIKICPKCGSTNITIPPTGRDIIMTITDYCRDCRNMGIFPEVDIAEIKDFKKKLKR